MPDQSYELLIKIVAELAQAKSSADELTRQIKIAKEAGQSYDALAKSLELVEQRMGQLEVAATKANQAMDAAKFAAHPSQNEVANPRADSAAEDAALQKRLAGYKAELEARRELNAERERYESSASQNTTANPRAGATDEDAAQATRMAGYRTALQARKELSGQAAKEVADYTSLTGATKQYILDLNDTNVATNKLTISKGNLKSALKGLKDEFPMLGHIGRLALNPITGVVAAIAAGYAVWRWRANELNKALGETELPDIGAPDVARVNQMAEAYKNLAKAIGDATDKFNSVAEANDRSIKQITQTVELRKKELEAMKALELAKLEAQKDDLEPEDFSARKGEIEERYGRAGLSLDKQKDDALLERKSTRAHSLGLEARDEMNKAGGIHISTQKDEESYEAKLKAHAEEAEKEIKRHKEQKDFILDYQDKSKLRQWGGVDRYTLANRYSTNPLLMPTDEELTAAKKQEDDQIKRQQIAIDRYNNFLKQKPDRQRKRDEKAQHEKKAAEDLAEKATLEAGLPGDVQSAKERKDSAARTEAMKTEAERIKAESGAFTNCSTVARCTLRDGRRMRSRSARSAMKN